ncbi:MAG: GMC family oxidoreductase [Spirochaetia bacterium]|nr:GMC family oxidoreductase [Spirochaetia bacterium]
MVPGRTHMADSEVYDYIIVGSGFGGSVSAMRLAQKGYKVLVIESGKRYNASDFPETNWNVRKFLWMPKIFLYGIQRINLLGHVMILSGAGVGGGSLVYANTLYVPKDKFFHTPTVKAMGGYNGLAPFYQLAQKMLGVVQNKALTEVDSLMKDVAGDFGASDTFTSTPVGVYFGKAGVKTKDPFFMGEGPDRVGCNFCGGCMVGCRFESKNTLDKNYLYFAEKLGAEVLAEHKVIDIFPLSDDGKSGYEVTAQKTTGVFGQRVTFKARNMVLSGGVLGTVALLFKMKETGRLPNLSSALGGMVRTNSEAIVGVTSRDPDADFSKGIAITSSVHPTDDTHIEPVRYSKGSDVMGMLATVLTDGGGRIPRPLRFLMNIVSHPIDFLRTLAPSGFAQKSIILLVMQTVDNSIRLVHKRRWIWPFTKSVTSAHGDGEKIPTYIPVANEFAKKMAAKINGVAQSSFNEVLLDVPTTAHILGGCSIGRTKEEGVIDMQNRVFGYENIIVCDGSMIPANLGVNPSLTITALSERAMSFVPPADEVRTFKFEKSWKVTALISGPKARVPKRRAVHPKRLLPSAHRRRSVLPQSRANLTADIRRGPCVGAPRFFLFQGGRHAVGA